MRLEFESGKVCENATESDIRGNLSREGFAVLFAAPGWYLQCAEQNDNPRQYLLEYQEGDTNQHYGSVAETLSLDEVLTAFCKYLRGDASWKDDFRWEKIAL